MAKKAEKEDVIEPRAYADGIPVWCVFDKLVDPVQLNPNPDNPNHHPQEQIELGARIIRGQGWRACITVSKQSGYITKGHGRLEFAKLLGVKEVPVDYQDYASKELELADVLADNRLAELAEMDIMKVQEITEKNLVGRIEFDLCGYVQSDLTGRIDVPPNDDDDDTGSGEGDDEGDSDDDAPETFKEIDGDDMEFDHVCPKCGFGFNDS